MSQALLKRIEALEAAQQTKTKQHIIFDGNSFTVPHEDPLRIRTYQPSIIGQEFHDGEHNMRLLIGPYGSGKSSMCCAEIVRRTCEMPAWSSGGVRRSKWAVIRNTTGELTSTTLQTWLHWFSDLGDIVKRQKPILTYQHTFNDGNGLCEIELIFLALDREDDLRKIRSLEVTGVYINELSEVPRGTIMHFMGRLRYPSKDQCPDYWSGIIADTNPPDKDHWIYKVFEEDRPANYRIFHQPPGLIKDESGKYITNPNAENISHLQDGYYTRMAEGQNEEFVKVFCLGQYGSVIMGKRVYPEYNDDFHSNDEVQILKAYPYHIGWDFGLTPACIFVQFTDRGQLRIFKEFIAEDMGIRQFAELVVLPYIKRELEGMKLGYSQGDPAGNTRSQTDEQTCLDTLTELGVKTDGSHTNSIVTRIEGVKYFLTRLTDGFASLLVCRKGAPKTRKGFLGDYHYRRLAVIGEERYHETPHKNMASHPHDALQYIALKFCESELKEKKVKENEKLQKAVMNPAFRYL